MDNASRCHLGSAIAWKRLAMQISVDSSLTDSSFIFNSGSLSETRNKAVVSVAYDLASKIASHAREQLASVPTPDAPPDSLTAAGIVDGALFPPELVSSCFPVLNVREVQHFDNWHYDWDSVEEPPLNDLAAFLLHALTHPVNPFTHIGVLGFLAQRADTDVLPLLEIPYKRGAAVLRSADVIHELSMTTAYAPTYGHYDLYWRQGAIGRYIDLTLRYYTYLNLLIAVDSNDALRDGLAQKLTDFPGRDGFCPLSRPDDQPVDSDPDNEEEPLLLPEHDALHHPFWAANGDRDPERTQVYLQRCFDVVVAWYALMRTASNKNRAIGDFESPTISFDDVVGGILEAFKSFGDTFALPPFTFPLGEFLKEYIDDFVYPEPQDLIDMDMAPESPNWKNKMLDLPFEVLEIIVSLVPHQDLIALSHVSRKIRMHAIKILFADPFGRNSSADALLSSIMKTSPELREAVHNVALHSGKPRSGTAGYSQYLSNRQGMGFSSSLALQLPNLRKMDLTIQSTQLWTKAGTNTFYTFLHTAQSRWPDLRSIDIIYHQKDKAMQQCLGDVGLTWKLENVSFERYLDAEFEAHIDTPGKYLDDHVPLVPLLSSSVDTLRTLSLSTCKKDIGDVSSFPQFPHLTKLTLTSNLTSRELSTLLSKFPAVRNLEVSVSDWAQEESTWPWSSSGPAIDFAKVVPGLHSLSVAFYDIGSIPDSCVRLSGVGETNPEVICAGPFPFVLKETKVVKELILVGYREEPLEQAIPRLALDHPSVVYLEIRQHFYDFDDYEDLVVIAILENFSRLETLILPRRRMYGTQNLPDDDLDGEEKKMLRLFKKSKTLKVAALKGIPSDDDNANEQQSSRVWVRSADGGVHTAGRDAIPVID